MKRLALIALILGVAPLVGNFSPASQRGSKENLDARIARLVTQLGDSSYATRQRATKQLGELGIATKPRLTEAISSQDAEVRVRASKILEGVLKADFQVRLEAFASDIDGSQKQFLPCWDAFYTQFGSEKNARALFVEMQRAEPQLLEAVAHDSKQAATLLLNRLDAIALAMQSSQFAEDQPTAISFGTLCAVLFASSQKGILLDDQNLPKIHNLIHLSSFPLTYQKNPLFHRILGQWVLHYSNSVHAVDNLALCFQFNLKEGLELAIKALGASGGPSTHKHYVLLAIARFGNQQQIGLVEPLLQDETVLPGNPAQDSGPASQLQLRDVALAVLVHLSRQDLKDYGFTRAQTDSQTVFHPTSLIFETGAKRDAALKKWREWSEKRTATKSSD